MKRSSSEVASPHDVAELQKRKKKRPKPSGEADNAASPAASVGHGAATEAAAPVAEEAGLEPTEYPYEVDDADHCESPLEAYKDISFFLEEIAKMLKKSKAELRVYDPYFCEGAVVRRLGELGFTNVYNRKEDFYAVIAAGKTPEFDVLVTNPPYSGDNVLKLMNFSLTCGKPFFLLMPNYVYGKEHYTGLRGKHAALFPSSMFFVSPKNRYLYTTPKGRRQQKSSKYTSPFPSFWYCSVGSQFAAHKDRLIGAGLRVQTDGWHVSPSTGSLPLYVLVDSDPRKKKFKNALKRKKHKSRQKQNAN